MSKPLTARAVELAKPDPSGRREIPDGHLPGLYLVVQPSGAKAWACRYRRPSSGKPAKLTIGSFPAFGLIEARKAAGEALRAVAEGNDPAALKHEARARAADRADTVSALLDEFLKRHVEVNNKTSTAAEHKRLIERNLRPVWGERRIQSIARADVIKLLDETRDRGAEITANRLLALVRVFFSWLIARGVVETSPVTGVKPPTIERSRDRVLSDFEIRLVWQASAKLGWPFGPMVRVLLLTTQRRDEVAGMRWSELDLDSPEPAWTLSRSRTKNGKPHVIPLSPHVVQILRSLPHVAGPEGQQCDFVFNTNGRTHATGYSRAKAILDREILAVLRANNSNAQIENWRFHDLRRTAASLMARFAQPVHVVEAVLNHRAGTLSGIAGVYNRYDYAAEKTQALNMLARFVEQIAASEASEPLWQKVMQ